ncbi:hypothetical protein BH10ACT1_BH10ACT1_29600 [soil metagenome]
MTQQPSTDATSTDGPAGRVVVAGTDLAVTFTTRGETGEVEVDGTGPIGVAPAVVVAIDAIRGRHPETTFHLAADHPVADLDPLPEAVADLAGLPHRRDLLQLRRPLPVPADHPSRIGTPVLLLRPIDLGAGSPDVGAWLRVNNRAFAHHPDQGNETTDTLAQRRKGEPDHDAGFLVADDPGRPGELSGFCWTKVHPATDEDPELGEIYVIGVDPSHRGEGLGAAFTLAGLDHLAGRGTSTANLYVEADNEPALRLYDRLGFATHQRRRVYSA